MSILNRRVVASVTGIAATAAVAVSLGVTATAGAATNWATVTSAAQGGGMSALVAAAKAEGSLNVIALPDNWANYGAEMKAFTAKYGIKINDENPSGSSAQEIQALTQDKGRSSEPDVVDIGQAYATPQDDSLFSPYKVATWSAIPANAKDANGDWYNDYGGYMSFGCDMTVVKTCPTTWKALLSKQYKGDVALNGVIGEAAAATEAVAAAAVNTGGSASNAEPGIKFFQELKKEGNFNPDDCNNAAIVTAHQCPILLNWDYLNSASAWGIKGASAKQWKVVDPKGVTFGAYYVQAISANAPHPAAARLWEEFLYSTTGQNLWLQGGARPVELAAMEKAGTVDKKAAAALPPVSGKIVLPTTAQGQSTGEKIAAAFPA